MQRGYDHARLLTLAQHTRWARAALDELRSSDPAANDARAAVARIRSLLADSFAPCVDSVALLDPLGGSIDWLQFRHLVEPRRSALAEWMDQQFPSAPQPDGGRTSTLRDEELIAKLRELGDAAPFEARFDPTHPHWDGFDELADELARRSFDPGSGEVTSFGSLLLANAWQIPALPIAVARSSFDPSFATSWITAVLDHDLAAGTEVHRIEAFGIDLVLAKLLDHPEALSAFLLQEAQRILTGDMDVEDSLFFDMFDSDVVDHHVLADVISTVLNTNGPVPLADMQHTFALFVQLANTTSFDRGFPEPMALALSASFVEILPHLEAQIRRNQTIYFDEIGDSDDALTLGDYHEVRDFIGALLVQPGGSVLLFALGDQSEAMARGDVTADDVNAFARLLRDAFSDNLAEIELSSARSRTQWAALTAAVSIAVGVGPGARVLGPTGVKLAQAAIKRFGSHAANTSTAGEAADDVGFVAELMIKFGSYTGFLDHYDATGGSDTQSARTSLAQAWAQFDSGAPLSRVAETLGDVREEIMRLGGAEFLDAERVATDHVEPVDRASDID
ncbi:MAG: hypothetical protein AB8G14_00190 [Ilumatobacter sp.]